MSREPKLQDILTEFTKLKGRVFSLERQAQTGFAVVAADKPLYLDGTLKLNYIIYNSTAERLEVWVDDGAGVSQLAGFFDLNNTGTRFDNV